MWYSRCSKIMPNVFDIVIFVLVASSILVSTYWLKNFLIHLASFIMLFLLALQLKDSFKQKMLINLNMLYSALQMKEEPVTRIVKDTIIYGLHFYLFSLNHSYIYLISFGLCLVYDLIIYNIAFNPLFKKYLAKKILEKYQGENKGDLK